MRDGRAENGHDAVAQKLVEGAVVLEGKVDHDRVEVIEERDHPLGVQVLRHGGEAPDIAEEDGDLAPLALEVEAVRVLEHLLHYFSCHVARECALDHFLLAQAPGHLVERLGQRAQLVARGHGQRDLEVAGSDGPRALDEPGDRAREQHGEPHGGPDAEAHHTESDQARLPLRAPHCGRDGLLAEAQVERAEADPAEGQGHRKVDDAAAARRPIRRHGQAVARGGERSGALQQLAGQSDVRMGPDPALLVGDDHVGEVAVLHGVLDQDAEREVVPLEQRGLGPRGEVLGDGEPALRHLDGQALLLLAQEEEGDEQDGEHEHGRHDQRDLGLERAADVAPAGLAHAPLPPAAERVAASASRETVAGSRAHAAGLGAS